MTKIPTILVAEDDPNLARYYEILLSQWNCETVVEHTGVDAIRRASTFQPDIALLGVVMPEVGGVEAGIKLLEICHINQVVDRNRFELTVLLRPAGLVFLRP